MSHKSQWIIKSVVKSNDIMRYNVKSISKLQILLVNPIIMPIMIGNIKHNAKYYDKLSNSRPLFSN